LSRVIAQVGPRLNRYPDRDANLLRADLATYLASESHVKLTSENIWPANGSNEVMQQLLQLFGGPDKKLVTFDPTYSMYEDYCHNAFTKYETVSRKPDFEINFEVIDQAIALHPDIIVLTSPNNPTGTVVGQLEIEYLLENFSGVVIIDEAYAEFRAPGTPSSIINIQNYPLLIVTRTMSKAFSYAGARIGYAVADPKVIAALQLVRLPYHLSTITQEAARVALRFSAELLSQVDLIRSERDELANWLVASGFEVATSGANFILFGTFSDRNQIWEKLVEQGVLIRQTGPAGWLRVSIGTPQENSLFKTALLKVTSN
jgi:histidinol-phosphate aminotransferase